jgi:ribosomal protein S18 acetylase RimI-like enzyme
MTEDSGHGRRRPEPPAPMTQRLADGTLVRIRPVGPGDRERLRNGFARLSPESKYRRFLAAPATLSESALDYLTETDGWNHLALGAVLAEEGADTSYGLGIARFVRLEDDPEKAEAAVAVIDEVQRRGLGRLLLRELIRAAREREVSTFVCHVLPSNEPVKSMLHEVDAQAMPHLKDGLLVYEMHLPEVLPDARDQSPIYRILRLAAEGLRVIFPRLSQGSG